MDIIPIRNEIVKWALLTKYQFDEKQGEMTVWVGKSREPSHLVLKVLYDDGIIISTPASAPRVFSKEDLTRDPEDQTRLIKMFCRNFIQHHANGSPAPDETFFHKFAS